MPFSASIIERSFAYVPDKILKLGGAAYLRPLGGPVLSTPWERIRIGVLCAVTPNGTSNINDIFFLLGLCAGQTNPGSAYVTNNFIGASMVGLPTPAGTTRTLTFNAGTNNPYFSCTAGVAFHKVDTSFIETSAAFSSGLLLPLANTGFYPRRAIIILDITKQPGGSGSLTFTVYYTVVPASVQLDVRPDHLFAALDQPGIPNVRGLTFAAQLSSTAVRYSPIGGEVDTFEIFWSSLAFPLEISALGASILRPLSYTDTGVADETFEEYSVSSGTVSTTLLSGGSGWSAAGSVALPDLSTSNLAPQVYTQYVGTTNQPDETFAQYTVGTIADQGTINLGTYWTQPIYVASPTGNQREQFYVELAGTNLGDHDTFASYATNSQGDPYIVSFNGGSYWGSTGTIYIYGTLMGGTTTSNLAPLIGAQTLAGTAYSAFDTFESYGTGTIVSGVTIVNGSFWAGAGSIY